MAAQEDDLTDRMTNCAVCFETYEEKGAHVPRILPCHHTFCEKCIEELHWQDTFDCPDCKVKHCLKNGVKGLALNEYVLTYIKRHPPNQKSPQEIRQILFKRLESLTEELEARKTKISNSKIEIDNHNSECLRKLRSTKKGLIREITQKFENMERNFKEQEKNVNTAVGEDSAIVEENIEKLDSLKEDVKNATAVTQKEITVKLEEIRHVAQGPLRVYKYCTYYPVPSSRSDVNKLCGYLSVAQQECKVTKTITTDWKGISHICTLGDDRIIIVDQHDSTGFWAESGDMTSYLVEYNLQTGGEVQSVKLKENPQGMAQITLGGKQCLALSYDTVNEILPNQMKIEFRDVNKLKGYLLSYSVAQLKPQSLCALSPTTLVFTDKLGRGIWWLDCKMSPPKHVTGKNNSQKANILDMCCVNYKEKQLLVTVQYQKGLVAYDASTGKQEWRVDTTADAIATDGRGRLFVSVSRRERYVDLFTADGQKMGTMLKELGMGSIGKICWCEDISSLIVVESNSFIKVISLSH